MADFLSQCKLLVSIESFKMSKCQWAFWVGVTGHLLNDLFQVDPIQTKNCFTRCIFVFYFQCVWKGGIEFCCTMLHCMCIGGQTLVMGGAVWPPHFSLYNQYSLTVDTFYNPLCFRVHSFIHSFIHSIGMCRMWRFLAVLRSFFHSSLLCNFSCHPSPRTILPSSLTSSCHLFLGLPLNLVVPRFIYNTLLGILFSSILCPNQHNLFNLIVSVIVGFFNSCIDFFIG